MSGPCYTHARPFTWHGFKLTAPGGNLGRLVCATPRTLWDWFEAANDPVHPKVYKQIKSCLTQVYLVYLEEAKNLKLLAQGPKSEKKKNWKSSPEWASLEGMLINSRQVTKSSNTKENKTLGVQGKACLASILTNGKSHAPGCSNSQQSVPGPCQSTLTETHHGSQEQSHQELPDNSGYIAFATSHNLSSTHPSASLAGSLPLSPDSSEFEMTARFKGGSFSNNVAPQKRSSISYDADNETDQHINKKLKHKDCRTKNLPLLGDKTASGFKELHYQPFAARPSAANPRLSPVTDNLACYKNIVWTSTNAENKPPKKALGVRQLTTSAIQEEQDSRRFNALSCTTDLVSETGATLWLNYNLGGALRRHPPSVPADVKTLDAMQQARPYLLSLKTRLVSLSSAAEDVRDATLNKWIGEEIGRALKDTETAWDCLKIGSKSQDVVDQGAKDRDAKDQEIESQDTKDQDTVSWNESDEMDDLP